MRALAQGCFLSPKLNRLAGRPREQPQQQQQQPGLAPQSPQEEGHQVVHRPPVRQEGEGAPWAHGQGGAGARFVSPTGFSLLWRGVRWLSRSHLPRAPSSVRGVHRPSGRSYAASRGARPREPRLAATQRHGSRVRRSVDRPVSVRAGGSWGRPVFRRTFALACRRPSAPPAWETPARPRRGSSPCLCHSASS